METPPEIFLENLKTITLPSIFMTDQFYVVSFEMSTLSLMQVITLHERKIAEKYVRIFFWLIFETLPIDITRVICKCFFSSLFLFPPNSMQKWQLLRYVDISQTKNIMKYASFNHWSLHANKLAIVVTMKKVRERKVRKYM